MMSSSERTITVAELRRLLDLHGTDRRDWPVDAWTAAAALVARSADARAAWEDAAAFDRMVGTLPPAEPSPVLVARVLADAPAPPLPARWRRAATIVVPLAAAAGLALWLARGTTMTERVAQPVDLSAVAIGEYTSPTDYLLDPYGVDVSDSVPSLGCDDSALGCPDLDGDADMEARSRV
jgi:hypothetical protein